MRLPTIKAYSSCFQGGKLDLTEVEGIADLLAAETAAQHRQVPPTSSDQTCFLTQPKLLWSSGSFGQALQAAALCKE